MGFGWLGGRRALGNVSLDGLWVAGGPRGGGGMGWSGYIIEDALMVSSGLRSSYISSVVERRSFLAFQRIM